LNGMGLVEGPGSWLSASNPVALLVCVILAEIWRATSIVLVILVAGVQLIPKEYNEAAEVFGATPWTRFIKITLPLLKPSLQSALILRTVLAFEVFAVVYALAGRDFPVLVGEAYNWQGAYQNTHVASVYALFILVISMLSTLVYLKFLRVRRETLS
jgi:multiple sugar transport system permease protein